MKSNIICSILFIRRKQIGRTVLQLGLLRLIVLLVLCFFALAMLYISSADTQKTILIAAVWALTLAFIHAKRPDKTFLFINADFDKLVYCVEYLILSIPFIACFLIRQQWLPAACLALCTFGIGLVRINRKKRQKTLNTRLQQYVPSGMYEWKSGVRQYFFFMVTVWLAGLFSSFFVAGVPVAMLLLGLFFCDFYKTNEPWQMLLSYRKNADKLLRYKIKQHCLLYGIINLPLMTLFLIFHLELWYIIAIEFVALLSIHIFCIALKYAFYSHKRSGANSVFQAIGIFIGLILPTTPVLWLLSLYLYLKARTNLYPYLNDYNQ